MAEQWTIKKMLDWGAEYFKKQNIESPRLNIEHLLAHVLKRKRIELYMEHDRFLSQDQLSFLKPLIQRRAQCEPLQYILGETDFYQSTFKVCSDVLIPRPETEILVDLIVKALRQRFPNKTDLRLIDLGTGSGNIALSLAKEFPQALIYAVDQSTEAIAQAQQNARLLGVEDQVEFLCGHWFEPFANKKILPVDLIVSNPPYVTETEYPLLAKEVCQYEPKQALVAGPLGIEMYALIIPTAYEFLAEGGMIAFEVGMGQALKVKKLLNQFKEVVVSKDFNDIERVVMGVKNG